MLVYKQTPNHLAFFIEKVKIIYRFHPKRWRIDRLELSEKLSQVLRYVPKLNDPNKIKQSFLHGVKELLSMIPCMLDATFGV